MSEPFEPDNDFLDMLACLGEIERECPSPRATGTATGLIRALTYEAEKNYHGSPAFHATFPRLMQRIETWEGALAERVKARLSHHHARLSNL